MKIKPAWRFLWWPLTQFNWGKSPKLSSNHRWFLLKETLRNSALQILIIKKKKKHSELIAQQITAGRAKRECGLFLSLCYHPKLALIHTFSLFLTSKWATWASGSAKKLRDNRHKKTHPQAPLTKSSHRHAHKKKSFTAFELRLASTVQSLTHTCRTLYSVWWQPQKTQNDYFTALPYLYVTLAL